MGILPSKLISAWCFDVDKGAQIIANAANCYTQGAALPFNTLFVYCGSFNPDSGNLSPFEPSTWYQPFIQLMPNVGLSLIIDTDSSAIGPSWTVPANLVSNIMTLITQYQNQYNIHGIQFDIESTNSAIIQNNASLQAFYTAIQQGLSKQMYFGIYCKVAEILDSTSTLPNILQSNGYVTIPLYGLCDDTCPDFYYSALQSVMGTITGVHAAVKAQKCTNQPCNIPYQFIVSFSEVGSPYLVALQAIQDGITEAKAQGIFIEELFLGVSLYEYTDVLTADLATVIQLQANLPTFLQWDD